MSFSFCQGLGSRLINYFPTSYDDDGEWVEYALKGNFSFVIPLTSYAHAHTKRYDDDDDFF